MWTFKKNIATYQEGGDVLILDISLVDDGNGSITTQQEEVINTINIDNPIKMATIMRELGEAIQTHGMEHFTTYHSCKWCGTIFPPKRSDAKWCGDPCKNKNRHLKNQIERGSFDECDLVLTWSTGKLELGDEPNGELYDKLTYRNTTCKILQTNIFMVDSEDIDEEKYQELYLQLKESDSIVYEDIDSEGEAVVIFDKKGDEPNEALVLAYKYAENLLLEIDDE